MCVPDRQFQKQTRSRNPMLYHTSSAMRVAVIASVSFLLGFLPTEGQ